MYYRNDDGDTAHETDLLTQFDEWIDEHYDGVEIMGIDFTASSILKESDPIAHRTYFSDWMDSENWEEAGEELPEDDDV